MFTNFILECTIFREEEPDVKPVAEEFVECWLYHVDKSSGVASFEIGLILTSPKGVIIEYSLSFRFNALNNEAEYEALVIGLKISKELEV